MTLALPARRARALACAAFLAVAAACDDRVTAPASAPAPRPPRLALQQAPVGELILSSSVLLVPAGEGGEVAVLLVARGDSLGRGAPMVTLAAEGLPAGVGATFRPDTLADSLAHSTLVVAADSSAAPGTYEVTVRATAHPDSGAATSRTARLTLVVARPPRFVLTLAASAVVVPRGGRATVGAVVRRAPGDTASLTLSLDGAPRSLAARFAPDTLAGDSAQLTLAADLDAKQGSYSLLVRARAADGAERTVPLRVSIVAPTEGDSTVLSACDAAGAPLWVAHRGADGRWRRVAPDGARYRIPTLGSGGALAFVTGSAQSGFALAVQYGGEALSLDCDAVRPAPAPPTGGQPLPVPTPPALRRVAGTLLGLDAASHAIVSLGSTERRVGPGAGTHPFVLDGVPATQQLLAALRVPATEGSARVPDRMILRRALPAARDTVVAPLDFSSDEAFAPIAPTLTVLGLGGAPAAVAVSLYDAPSLDRVGTATLFSDSLAAGRSALTYRALPAARRAPTDLYAFTVTSLVMDTVGSEMAATMRMAMRLAGTPTDLAIDLGPGAARPTVELLTTGAHPRFRARWQGMGGYGAVGATFTQFAGFTGIPGTPGGGLVYQTVSITRSAGAEGGAGSDLTLELPDFSGVEGWSHAWAPLRGVHGTWQVSATDLTLGTVDPRQALGGTAMLQLYAGWQTRMAMAFGSLLP